MNFSYEGLSTVSTDTVPFDDSYDVTNLISTNPSKRSKGFLSAHFVKPPVHVDFELFCRARLSRVVIHTRIGGQRSAGVEILSGDSHFVSFGSICGDSDSVEFSARGEGLTNSILFRGSRHLSVRRLRVRIFKTANSSVPALKGVEIWGRPEKSVGSDMVNKAWKLYSDINRSPSPSVRPVPPSASPNPTSSSVAAPDDFLDPITCEIMTLPMTLPSGNTVDLSTLERFHSEEAHHGRGPSDPFTGVLFTAENRPLVATALRQRIDQFLLIHSTQPQYHFLPRTTGRSVSSSQQSQPSTSKRDSSSLIDSALNGCPSYLSEAKKPKLNCFQCSSPHCLFKLTCGDLLCRNCLSSSKTENSTCPSCQTGIDFTAIIRFHI